MFDSKTCRICNRRFSSSSNRHRHEVSFHGINQLPYNETMESNEISHSDEESDTDQSDQHSVEENNENESDGNHDILSDNESNSSDSENEEDEQKYWSDVIRETCEDLKMQIPNGKLVFHPHNFDLFLEALFANINEKLKFSEYMLYSDDVFAKIKQMADKYGFENDDMDEDEALEKAWDDRKFLLRKHISKYVDVIEKEFEESDNEEQQIDTNNLINQNMI